MQQVVFCDFVELTLCLSYLLIFTRRKGGGKQGGGKSQYQGIRRTVFEGGISLKSAHHGDTVYASKKSMQSILISK